MATVVIGSCATAVQFLILAWRPVLARLGQQGGLIHERYPDRRPVSGRQPAADPDRHAYRRRADAAVVHRRLGDQGLDIAGRLLASSVATSIASDAFARHSAVRDDGAVRLRDQHGARHVRRGGAARPAGSRGGLGIATVAANAVFAACTGTSIASASVFTKVAVPEMMRHGHTPEFSVGVVAGSSVLGMLIPPSLLMIIFGVIVEHLDRRSVHRRAFCRAYCSRSASASASSPCPAGGRLEVRRQGRPRRRA